MVVQFRVVAQHLGTIIAAVGLSQLLAVPWSFIYGDDDWQALIVSTAVAVMIGVGMHLLGQQQESEIGRREGLLIVAGGWVLAAAVGALPFWIYGVFPSYTDAFFEATSGFTTTGATVASQLEDWPHGLLFWRSFMHWLGGMGIIVFFIAVLPLLGVGGRQLFKSEVPGPVKDGMLPRVQQTARMLWLIYLGLSVAETLILWALGMSLFEALCHTFGTVATAGFSTRSASVGAYDSIAIELVIIVFMLISGVNFSLHYQLLRGRTAGFRRDVELHAYLGIYVVGVVALTLILALGQPATSWPQAFRLGAFQSASLMTTTGFTTGEFGAWPPLAQFIVLMFMFVGGCAGSTGGSVKIVRLIVLAKVISRELRHALAPREVRVIKLGRRVVDESVVNAVIGFFLAFLALFALGSMVLMAMGIDFVTAMSASAATVGNIGPGLGAISPPYDYAFMPTSAKWVLSLLMLCGRLEIFTVLVLLLPRFWRG